MTVNIFGYYLTAARRAGVPEFWLEDAAQEIAIRVWQAPDANWRGVVHYAAIDAARRYGQRNRRHTRPWVDGLYKEVHLGDEAWEEPVYVESHDLMGLVDELDAFERAWPRLTVRERECIVLSVERKRTTTNTEQKNAGLGRRKLRRLCA